MNEINEQPSPNFEEHNQTYVNPFAETFIRLPARPDRGRAQQAFSVANPELAEILRDLGRLTNSTYDSLLVGLDRNSANPYGPMTDSLAQDRQLLLNRLNWDHERATEILKKITRARVLLAGGSE